MFPHISRAFVILPISLILAGSVQAQSSRKISGEVRLGTEPAPAGVPVLLQIVTGKYVAPSTEPEVAHTVTDAKGQFQFDGLEKVGSNSGREFFAVTAKVRGYAPAFQVVDLTLVSRIDVSLELRKPGAQKQNPSETAPAEAAGAKHEANPRARQHLDLAQELLFRKHIPEAAIEELKEAIKADPWNGGSYLLLGLAQMELQRWGDAQLAFSEATKVEPGNAQAYLGLGSALNEQHDYEAAQKELKRSLELKPDSAEAHYELARSLCALERWDAAEPHARRALELNSDYSGPHALMGNIYLQQQDLPSARREFQEYLRLDPEGDLAAAAKQAIAQIDQALAQNKNRR